MIELPPLILHPFADEQGTQALRDSTESALAILKGKPPKPAYAEKLLRGRYLEVRMLCFVGRDLKRWMGQSMEQFQSGQSAGTRVQEQSLAHFLVQSAPPHVAQKLRSWGVADYPSLFSRAIGLNAVFQEPPTMEELTPQFLRQYYRFADYLFGCFQQLEPFTVISPDEYSFELYASGEYSRLLESGWGIA